MFEAVVLSAVVLTIIVCVLSLSIVTTSERFAAVEARIKALERRKPARMAPPAVPPAVSGNMVLMLDGKTRTVKARFEPTSIDTIRDQRGRNRS